MTSPFRPLFRTVRADGAVCSLTFAEDGAWMLLLDQKLIDTGRSSGGGVEEAVNRFRALSTGMPIWSHDQTPRRYVG